MTQINHTHKAHKNLNDAKSDFIFLICVWVQGMTGIMHAQCTQQGCTHTLCMHMIGVYMLMCTSLISTTIKHSSTNQLCVYLTTSRFLWLQCMLPVCNTSWSAAVQFNWVCYTALHINFCTEKNICVCVCEQWMTSRCVTISNPYFVRMK